MARRVLMAEVSGGRARERPRLGYKNGAKVALGNRAMTVTATRQDECMESPEQKSEEQRSERMESPGTYVTE